MNWDFLNRKLKEFFESRRQQSIDKIFAVNTHDQPISPIEYTLPKKALLDMETQITEDVKLTNPTQPILYTPTKSKQTPKSFSQISHIFSPHGPARSTASMQIRQIVASTMKNNQTNYKSVKNQDIRKIQTLIGTNSSGSLRHSRKYKQIKQPTRLTTQILSEFKNELDNSPLMDNKPSQQLKTFVTQTKKINTLSMCAQMKTQMNIKNSHCLLSSQSQDLQIKENDPRGGLDRFLNSKWLQFIIEQKSMRKDDQFQDYLQQQVKDTIQMKRKYDIRKEFNSEIPSQLFKPHRYTPHPKVTRNIKQIIEQFDKSTFQITIKQDEDQLLDFYPNYYEKKVKKKRILRKMKALIKRAIKQNMPISKLLDNHRNQVVPYQQQGSIAFLRFVKRQHLPAVKTLLEQHPSLIGAFDELGQYAIHLAVISSNIDMVKLVLYYGDNVNAEDLFLQKPLYFALLLNNLQISKLLLACGASPWDSTLRDYFAVCKSVQAKNLIKLAQYMNINKEDLSVLLHMDDDAILYQLNKQFKC